MLLSRTLIPPREGSVKVFGTEVSRMSAYQVAALGVGYVPEGRKIFGNIPSFCCWMNRATGWRSCLSRRCPG